MALARRNIGGIIKHHHVAPASAPSEHGEAAGISHQLQYLARYHATQADQPRREGDGRACCAVVAEERSTGYYRLRTCGARHRRAQSAGEPSKPTSTEHVGCTRRSPRRLHWPQCLLLLLALRPVRFRRTCKSEESSLARPLDLLWLRAEHARVADRRFAQPVKLARGAQHLPHAA